MNKQYLLIHGYKTLYEILSELKNILSFELKFIKENNFKIENLRSNELVISTKNFDSENQIKLNDLPIEIDKLIDYLNINFLKKKIKFQKDIKIGVYQVNFNTRKMFKNKKHLNLTEKESKIINFLNNSNSPVSVSKLQNEVWGYKSQLETHTVETHIYRLRKKIENVFKDKTFIRSYKEGYQIS
ncbi:winged helix-turn-helix domain-containing protein [Candidatus Pelagibacter sp.]|nr:winged helix-turn-helix domain-containing protein [Candidatus Pelagibacter sp.]